MQNLGRCYLCLEDATETCQNTTKPCTNVFCALHGDSLCETCQKEPPEDDEDERKHARDRFFRDESPPWHFFHRRHRDK